MKPEHVALLILVEMNKMLHPLQYNLTVHVALVPLVLRHISAK